MEEMLEVFYRMALEDKIELGVWVSIPGAIISGKLTTIKKFYSVLVEHPMFGDWGQRMLKELKDENENDKPEVKKKEIEYIYLIDVMLTLPPSPVYIPWAIVRAKDISAWGLGQMEIRN